MCFFFSLSQQTRIGSFTQRWVHLGRDRDFKPFLVKTCSTIGESRDPPSQSHRGPKERFLPLSLLLFLTSSPSPSSPVLVLFPLGFGSIFFFLAMAWLKQEKTTPPHTPPPPLPPPHLPPKSCIWLMGSTPKSNRTIPWGGGGCHSKKWPLLGGTGHFGMPQPCANRMPVSVCPGAAFWLWDPSPRRDMGQAGRWGPWWEAGPILSPSPRSRAQYPDVKEPLEVSV